MAKKCLSFYDWELQFRRNSVPKNELNKNIREKQEQSNILGINKDVYDEFIKNWKRKNLS
jgi:hypothetical protein